MRRFTLITGFGEAELVADPDGVWVPLKDVQRLQKKLEEAIAVWDSEDEGSPHVRSYLKAFARELA